MPPKERGFDFWRNTLREAKLIVAPMVDSSELAWRLLSRKYGAHLTYTPMIHSVQFINDKRYRKDSLQIDPSDRPLIAQFCANDPNIFIEAAKLAAPHCDAIDLNLGCPQMIARRGHYGAFLQDEWDLVYKLVNRIYEELDIPITCKVRVFEDIDKTVRYAKMLESAGAQLLTVHGRTREQKGPLTGMASWDHIRAVRQAVNIPVFANGNIQSLADVDRCVEETGVQGVMTAEGNLHNPCLFLGIHPPVWRVAEEYLNLVKTYPCPLSFQRGHLFKIFYHVFSVPENGDLRQIIAKACSSEEFWEVIVKLKERYAFPASLSDTQQSDSIADDPLSIPQGTLPLPPYVCQPYFRQIKLAQTVKNNPSEGEDGEVQTRKRVKKPIEIEYIDANGEKILISKKKWKKLRRNPNKNFSADALKQMNQERRAARNRRNPNNIKNLDCEMENCLNKRGQKCEYSLCRVCCRNKTFSEVLNCMGHRFTFLRRQERRAAALEVSTTQGCPKVDDGLVIEFQKVSEGPTLPESSCP